MNNNRDTEAEELDSDRIRKVPQYLSREFT